jgi:hypothetical protein
VNFKTLLAILGLALGAASCGAQTTVVARPVSDAYGYAVFQITQVVRVEGEWVAPPHEGQILYLAKPARAHPLLRFGEAVIATLPQPGNMVLWQGVHVHNGCIPALGGIEAEGFVSEIARRPVSVEAVVEPVVAPEQELKFCPVCQKQHLRG